LRNDSGWHCTTIARNDRGRKRDLLARFDIPEYWIVDADARRIEVSVWRGGHYGDANIAAGDRLVSATIPELALDLAELFRDLD